MLSFLPPIARGVVAACLLVANTLLWCGLLFLFALLLTGAVPERMSAKGVPLYAQHVDGLDTGSLVDLFREDEDSCLLGTDALREALDGVIEEGDKPGGKRPKDYLQ